MKTYTEVLINTVEGGHKWYRADPALEVMHYEAKHKTEDMFIMWMEARLMRRRCTLPCLLVENGQPLVFKSDAKFANSGKNAMLMKRWSLFVTPKNIITDWEVKPLSKEEFLNKFKMAQTGELFEDGENTKEETDIEDKEENQ